MRRGAARKPPRNLAAYWQMEAANVVFVPGLAIYLGWPKDAVGAIALAAATLACAGFLVVGALYWRGLDRRLKAQGDEASVKAISFADRAERILLIALAAAIVATIAAWFTAGWSRTTIAAAILTLLAGLEYVNYYRWQLQYFDNLADLKRLLGGRLKRAHMARDLDAYRASHATKRR